MDGDGVQEPDEFLILAPGDRTELVFDFSKVPDGRTVHLQNVGPAFSPFQGLESDGDLAGDGKSPDRPALASDLLENEPE